MLGFVPQPNLSNFQLNSACQREAETQRERCLSLGYRSDSANQAQFKDTTKMNYLEIGPYSLGIDKKFELMGTLDSDLNKENLDDAKSSQIFSKEYLLVIVYIDGKENAELALYESLHYLTMGK
jgi:hypothetical protein